MIPFIFRELIDTYKMLEYTRNTNMRRGEVVWQTYL